jgi:hypothetical protein
MGTLVEVDLRKDGLCGGRHENKRRMEMTNDRRERKKYIC